METLARTVGAVTPTVATQPRWYSACALPGMSAETKRRRSRGYMLTEVLTVVGIAGTMATMAAVDVGKAIAHARSLAAVDSIAQTLSSARLAAVSKGVQVVVEISIEPAPLSRISLRTFEDRSRDFVLGTYTVPPSGASRQEAILNDFVVDSSFHLWKKDGLRDDLASAALFNTYAANPALTQRIVFTADGGVIAPQAPSCAAPTPTSGRGIYVADAAGKNFYRLTFATMLLGHVRIDRWGANGYQPTQGNV